MDKGNGCCGWVALSARLALAVWLSLALTGCLTYRYLPQGDAVIADVTAPVELADFNYIYKKGAKEQVTGAVIKNYESLVDNASMAEFNNWFQGQGDDISASFSTKTVRTKGAWTILPYLVTLTLVPAMVSAEAQSTLTLMSGDTVLHEHTESFKTKSYLSVYFPTPLFLGNGRKPMLQALLSDQFARHKLALGQYIASNRAAYEQAVAVGTVSGYREFVKNNPDSFFRMEALGRLAELEPESNALAFHRANLNADPAYLAYLPDRYDIWFLGPDDMHVYEVLRLSKTEEEVLLAARIKAAGQPYKVFNGEEIAQLKEGGLSATLIAAMIEVSGQAPAAQGVPGATVVPVTSAVSGAPGAPGPPGSENVAAQCTKRLLAMKACSQIPSFGANICRGQVAKKYSHVACSFIN